jgi:VIT1/CCC1 family predicted Fe2+/Mn2+ transporter
VSRHKKFEPHHQNSSGKLNKLRAAVLGANDGIVSIAGLVVGVAGASSNRTTIFAAGIAGILAGAFSMAAGEYVSVSSQRDTERALLRLEKSEIEQNPKEEQEELVEIYMSKGLSARTAQTVAAELTQKDAYRAHLDAELAINPEDLVNPWQAAFSSAIAFFAGSLLPMLAIMLPPQSLRISITFVSTLIALAINGAVSAKSGGAPMRPAVQRVVIGGALAMIVTYSIGRLIGSSSI